METYKNAMNIIDGFLQEIEALASRARQEYDLTKDVNIEEENFDRLENKIYKFLKEKISQAEADRFNKKLHPGVYGVSMNSWVNFINHNLKPIISYLQGLSQACECEDIELIFEKVSAEKDNVASQKKYIIFFDNLLLHSAIIKVSRSLYMNSHYAQAIFEAFKAVNNYVKHKTGRLDLDGQQLMARVFDENDPLIKLNPLQTRSEKDEQLGFKFIYMGVMTGIRNPKAHDHIKQKDPIRTLKYLALASLLIERAEEGKVNV